MSKSTLLKAGIIVSGMLSHAVWAELPDVETIPINEPAARESFSESSGGPSALQDWFRKVNALQSEVQMLRGMVEEQNHLIQQLSEKQKTLYLDLDRRISKKTEASSEGTPSETLSAVSISQPVVPVPTVQTEESTYQYAYDLLKSKAYTEAKDAFQQHLTQYPNGQYTPNVYYWLGEINLLNKDYTQAAVDFHQVIDYYPLHPKAPDALLKLGYVAAAQGDLKVASETLQNVQMRFPNTSAARLAGNKLQEIRQAGKS